MAPFSERRNLVMRARKLVFAGTVAALAACVVAGAAWSQETTAQGQDQGQNPAPPAAAPVYDLSFNVGAATDYVFRGVSQTDENSQIFAAADLTAGRWYAGVWASNIDYNDGTEAEVDLYGGFKPEFAGLTLDLGAIVYLYPGQPDGADYDYIEAKVGASRSFGAASVAVNAFYSPDFFGAEDEALFLEGSLGYTVREGLSVSGALGRQWVSSDLDYTTWNAGVNWAFAERLALDVRYFDTDEDFLGELGDGRLVAAIKATF